MDKGKVPQELEIIGSWGWRLLVGLAVSGVVVLAVLKLEVVFVGLFVGLLISALLMPLRNLLNRRLPRSLSVVLTLLALLGVLGGIVTFVSTNLAGDYPELRDQFSQGLRDIQSVLSTSFLKLPDDQIQVWADQALEWMRTHTPALTSGGLAAVTTAGEIFSGVAIAFFCAIFFLYDGKFIWSWLRKSVRGSDNGRLEASGLAAWVTLTGYVRGTVVIASTDGVLVGIALLIMGVPLAGPLAVLVFLGAFVPIIGAVTVGFVAVLVALASQGVPTALAVLAVIILVQQFEGHVLHPVVMNKAVRVHPLMIVLSVASGTLLGGVVGAVVAVPLVAVSKSVVQAYNRSKLGLGAEVVEEQLNTSQIDISVDGWLERQVVLPAAQDLDSKEQESNPVVNDHPIIATNKRKVRRRTRDRGRHR